MAGQGGPLRPPNTAAPDNLADHRQNKTYELPKKSELKEGTVLGDFGIVFGSFSENEAKLFQSASPPVRQALHKGRDSLPSFQFGDLTGLGELHTYDTYTFAPEERSGENGAAVLPSVQVGSTDVSRRTPADEAAVQRREKGPEAEAGTFENEGDTKQPSKEGRVEQAQAQALAENDHRSNTKQAPKSWASLVGVQPVPGDAGRISGRASGQGKPVARLASKLTTEAVPKLQPRGLINTGNTCFANSTLQALLACPPFLNLLATIKSRTLPPTGFPALRAFASFAGQFRVASEPEQKDQKLGPVDVGRPFAPVMFDDVLRSFSPDQPPRGRPRQEDAQEFLSHVMDRLHEELLWLEGRSIVGQNAVVDDEEWEIVGPKNKSALTRTHMTIKSPLSDIFGGQLCSVVKAKGNKASATVQPFLVLHLDILSDAVKSIEDALRFFAAPESLEGYKAASSKASEVVSASKAIKIQSLPSVLIVHLMRFSYGASGSGKLNKAIKYSNSLTIGRELLATSTGSATEGRKYELVATVTHHGNNPSTGHYTADCRQPDGRWLRFDDAVVSVVPINQVLQEHTYVLFYKRVSH